MRSFLIAATLGCTLVTSSDLSAQTTDSSTTRRWELNVPSGTLVPTGAQRDAIKRGNLTAVQLSYVVRPAFALTTTLGWARSRDIAAAGSPKLDAFTYDLGAELRAPRWIASDAISFSPYEGVGAGGRSYNYRKLDVDATHNLAAYGSVGGELGLRRVRLRLEARDYVAGFKPLDGQGAARTSSDVVVMFGLRILR
jgi:hypothetical protein